MTTQLRKPWPRPKVKIRLGDAIAVIAQPVAKAIDRVLGTDIEHCLSCGARKRRLNGE